MRKIVVVTDCTRGCPYITQERTRGAGYAMDYICTKVEPRRKVIGYVEWPSELPKAGEFPTWCPLFEAEPGMYETPETKIINPKVKQT